jgi:hypothetical protein
VLDDHRIQEQTPIGGPGHEQRVNTGGGHVLQARVRTETVAGRRDHVPTAGRGHPGDVEVPLLVGHREHFERPDHIQEADTVVRYDDDPARPITLDTHHHIVANRPHKSSTSNTELTCGLAVADEPEQPGDEAIRSDQVDEVASAGPHPDLSVR